MTETAQGWIAPGFERVRERFAANFAVDAQYREVGSAFAAYHGDRLVVNLWGGFRDPECAMPWSGDTLVNVWSATKGVTALAVALLVDRGLIDYAARVTDYWPEYSANGKGDTTVSQLLSHQAGLPGFDDPTTVEDLYHGQAMAERLARQTPMWKPGEKNSYHAATFGFLAGELVRRVSGLSIGQFVAQEIAGPIAADVFIGLPASEEPRVATTIGSPPPIDANADLSGIPSEVIAAMTNPALDPKWANDRAFRAAEVPAANAQATALGLARMYAILANEGRFAGNEFLRPDTVAALGEVQTRPESADAAGPSGWTRGMHVNLGSMFGPNPDAFGHVGWGGSFGSVDVQARIAIGYAANRMGEGNTGDPRAAALTEALYACL